MKWFQGSIPEAIQKSKLDKTLFVVYVQGKDENTQKMDAVWEDRRVSSLCESTGVVAVKIVSDSEDGKFFGQIYPLIIVPCCYFIGMNGVPLEVTGGFVEVEPFIANIKAANQKLKEQIENLSEGIQKPAEPTASSGDNTQSPTNNTTDSAQAGPSTTTESASKSESPPSLNERVEKAQELLAEKRIEKQKKEEEDLKTKEEERRKLGRDMQKLRQFQAERERKEIEDQMKKDRDENKRAKERIREQIARDREERAARFKKEKEEQEKQAEEKKKQKLQAQQQAAEAEQAKRSESARIQIRLPDGSSISNTFSSSDLLESVYQFVTQNTGTELSLSTTYPKRYFAEEDRDQTLMSLNLAPSAVLIGVNRKSKFSRPSSGGGGEVSNTGILSFLFSPFLMLWNFIMTFLFGSGSEGQGQQGSSSQGQGRQSDAGSSSQSQQGSSRSYNRSSRPDGNIHRFRNIQDDSKDDDRTTWNGNSTQQM